MVLQVRTNVVLVGTDGRNLLNAERFLLFKSVRETGSISKAARKIQRPFRRVWSELKTMEHDCGFNILIKGPKGSRLTDECEGLLMRYAELSKNCERSAKYQFRKLFAE